MITDLFEYCTCKTCGNTSVFERLTSLELKDGTDYLCRCSICETFFIRAYERRVS